MGRRKSLVRCDGYLPQPQPQPGAAPRPTPTERISRLEQSMDLRQRDIDALKVQVEALHTQ